MKAGSRINAGRLLSIGASTWNEVLRLMAIHAKGKGNEKLKGGKGP